MEFYFALLPFLAYFTSVVGDGTFNNIYKDMSGVNVCIRRLNATHEIGCSSSRKGNVGVLHYVDNDAAFAWFLNKAPYKPYILMVTAAYFNISILDEANNSGKVNGLMLVYPNDTDVPSSFSPDDSCPNYQFEKYRLDDSMEKCSKVKWNPLGNSMFFQKYDFPIAILSNQSEISFLINDCYLKFNKPEGEKAKDFPQCAVQVKAAMDAAVNTPTCIRRSSKVTNLNPQRYCDSLKGNNVYSFLNKLDDSVEDDSVIAAITRLDSFTMFDGVAPATDSAVTGIVTILAAVQALSKLKKDMANAKPIMFIFFNGEAFGYSGSARFLYDMNKGELGDLSITKFDVILELEQVGLLDSGALWMHTDPRTLSMTQAIRNTTDELADYLQAIAAAEGLTINRADPDDPLPPASTQSFLKEERTIPHLVITDHEKEFTNNYYHSVYDNRSNFGLGDDVEKDTNTTLSEQLTNLATSLANLLFYRSTGQNATQLKANSSFVQHLIYCYLYNPKCELFKQTTNGDDDDVFDKLTIGSMNFYVTPTDGDNTPTRFTKQVLSYVQGDRDVPETCSETANKKCCEKADDEDENSVGYHYYWMYGEDSKGVCIKTTTNRRSAESPAFTEKDYNRYPAWTESSWALGAIFIRSFMLPPRWLELVTLAAGLGFVLVCTPLCYICNKRAHIIFESSY